MERKIRSYEKEFKENAVKLVLEGRKTKKDVAKDLGIPHNTLGYWLWKYQEDPKNCFPGTGHLKPQDEELRKLKKVYKKNREVYGAPCNRRLQPVVSPHPDLGFAL